MYLICIQIIVCDNLLYYLIPLSHRKPDVAGPNHFISIITFLLFIRIAYCAAGDNVNYYI